MERCTCTRLTNCIITFHLCHMLLYRSKYLSLIERVWLVIMPDYWNWSWPRCWCHCDFQVCSHFTRERLLLFCLIQVFQNYVANPFQIVRVGLGDTRLVCVWVMNIHFLSFYSPSIRPTLQGTFLLSILSLLRCFLLYFRLDCLICDFINDEVVRVCVILIGIIIAWECFCSIWSFTFLKEWRNSDAHVFSCQSSLLFLLSGSSVANSVWLFMQIRLHWTQHFSISMQILHGVPSILLLVQALLQGSNLHMSWTVCLLSKSKIAGFIRPT